MDGNFLTRSQQGWKLVAFNLAAYIGGFTGLYGFSQVGEGVSLGWVSMFLGGIALALLGPF